MKAYFRPLPGLTVASSILFMVLVGLGAWQLERREWKLALIATMSAHLRAAPISLDDALKRGPNAQYRRVKLVGKFDNAEETYVYTTGDVGMPVYHVVVPFVTAKGVLLVDRGIVLPMLLNPKSRHEGELQGEAVVTGVWRTPDGPGYFTPAPDLVHRIWYSRDVRSVAAADRTRLLAPVLVEADATPNPGGWPKGGQTQVTLRNEHLQYAITWFALAVALVALYLAYHVSKGRLGRD